MRGIRGAATVGKNSAKEILDRTCELLEAMVKSNGVKPGEISMALFTMSPDLDAAFPAAAARQLGGGWKYVPMMCTTEIGVPGSLERVIRILLLAETSKSARSIRHQYLGEATCLRPDLAGPRGPSRAGRAKR